MGKPAPAIGARPIALMPMLYRLWTKIRKDHIAQWDNDHREPFDAAVRGSSALRAAILSMYHDELNQLSGDEVIKILYDMEIFMIISTSEFS